MPEFRRASKILKARDPLGSKTPSSDRQRMRCATACRLDRALSMCCLTLRSSMRSPAWAGHAVVLRETWALSEWPRQFYHWPLQCCSSLPVRLECCVLGSSGSSLGPLFPGAGPLHPSHHHLVWIAELLVPEPPLCSAKDMGFGGLKGNVWRSVEVNSSRVCTICTCQCCR